MKKLERNRTEELSEAVDIVNRVARKKLNWKYTDNQIITARSSSLNNNATVVRTTENKSDIHFRVNPFFKTVTKLTSTKLCPASMNRYVRAFQFTLTEENRRTLSAGAASDDKPAFQIRFCCAAYTSDDVIPEDGLPMEFPTICELKVNDNVIAGTMLRGIKGKPGTVNPPDLTIMTKKSAHNTVELVYIQTEKQYASCIYIVERRPVQDLLAEMKEKRWLPKEDVLEKIQSTQEDNDIVMESETISTRCPLAFTRIVTPCRSRHCNHLQCFDAVTYLTMNEQTPTWACPVCYKKINDWEDLVVDGYFTEMLKNTPKHIESVKVEPTGLITIVDEHPDLYSESEEEEEEQPKKPEPEEVTILDDDDDDQDIILQPQQQHPTTMRNASNKRTIPEPTASDASKKQKTNGVIDLTFSSDDED
ncbi:zf-MIZ-domain-containing protein [Backusella circina FSU 941]|nr:zf-MIZ-domain-containing protein [Backusella circina FSU 941]